MTQITITPTYYGTFSETNFYRIDLSTLGLANIRSIQVRDDGFVGGPGGTINGAGSGGSSGFDLDFIEVNTSTSSDPLTSVNPGTVVGGLFDYVSGVVFHPGMLTPYVAGQPNSFQPTINNTTTLLGTTGANVYSPTQASLGSPNGFINGANGLTTRLALGEGGSITFNLSAPVSSGMLVIGDVLDFPATFGGDGVTIILSDQATIAPDTGLNLTLPTIGTPAFGGGTIDLTTPENAVQGAGADSLTGANGTDTLNGGGGNDFIRGLDGDDRVSGGDGDDDVNGNVGQDIVRGNEGNDTVRGGMNNDSVFGDGGNDGHVNGNIGNDSVSGGDGNDTCYGGQGDDIVYGDAGDDWLSGDLGNDTLYGRIGADRFLFRIGSGQDVVADFSYAEGDRVQLAPGTAFTAVNVAAGVAITLTGGTGDVLTLSGVTLAQLGADYVVFV